LAKKIDSKVTNVLFPPWVMIWSHYFAL